MTNFKKSVKWYDENLATLLPQYRGKYVGVCIDRKAFATPWEVCFNVAYPPAMEGNSIRTQGSGARPSRPRSMF